MNNAIAEVPPSLVAGIVAGDDRALGALYDAYGQVAYGLAFAEADALVHWGTVLRRTGDEVAAQQKLAGAQAIRERVGVERQ